MDLTTQLNEATERYSALLAENEALKERNNLLFKLGKGYLEMKMSKLAGKSKICGDSEGLGPQRNQFMMVGGLKTILTN